MSASISQLYFNVNLSKIVLNSCFKRAKISLRQLQLRASSYLINRIIVSNDTHNSCFYKGHCIETKTGNSNSKYGDGSHSSISTFSSNTSSRLIQALVKHHNAQRQLKRSSSNSSDDEDDSRHKLKLMDFPIIMWPNIIKTIRSWFLSKLIAGYFDNSFSTENFLQGAVQAVTFVSQNLSEGHFSELQGLVTHEALSEIRRNYADLNAIQKSKLAVIAEDIFLKFIYEIGMIFEDDTNQRFVEITVVLQGYHGLDVTQQQDMREQYKHVAENQDQIYVCNYRFIREFTKGVDDDWTINKLNHFLPLEQKKLQF